MCIGKNNHDFNVHNFNNRKIGGHVERCFKILFNKKYFCTKKNFFEVFFETSNK